MKQYPTIKQLRGELRLHVLTDVQPTQRPCAAATTVFAIARRDQTVFQPLTPFLETLEDLEEHCVRHRSEILSKVV